MRQWRDRINANRRKRREVICPACNRTFDRLSALADHVEVAHYTQRARLLPDNLLRRA